MSGFGEKIGGVSEAEAQASAEPVLPPEADVATVLDNAKLSPYHWRIILLCILATAVDGFDMQILPFTAPVMLKALGVSTSMLGPLIASALAGMVVSGFVGGLLSDRFGRRAVIVGGLLTFGIFTVAKGLVTTYEQLFVLQFLTGIGLGGVFTNSLALAAEYAPIKNRRFIVTCVSAAFPFGSFMASYLVVALMGTIGWNGVLVAGGLLAIFTFVVALFWLPGSARQMVLHGRSPERVSVMMRRLSPSHPHDTRWVTSERPIEESQLGDLFIRGRAGVTILLAATMVMSLMAGYFVTSFAPVLFTLNGLSPEHAAFAASMLHTGAFIGALMWGRLCDWIWPPLVLGFAASIVSVCYALIGQVASDYNVLLTVALIGGMGMGVHNAYNGFASSLYPTAMRATALGVVVGIGRIGSIAGPLVGGALIAAQWKAENLFLTAGCVASMMVVCMILMSVLPAPRRIVREARAVQHDISPAAKA